MPGSLFVVATPIGNLEDLTFRALRTLKEVDLIAAEDTRRTGKLLVHYQIARRLVSLHEHNEHREAPRLVERLLGGESIALVSDAGTPGISDPGSELIRLARSHGIKVVPIPGPSAITAALSISGLALPSFVFLGFPPASGAARERWFEALSQEPRTAVFFEAPHRIERTLAEVSLICGVRPIIRVRELTKVHEELVECTKYKRCAESLNARGEFVVIVGAIKGGPSIAPAGRPLGSYVELFFRMTEHAGISTDDAEMAVCSIAAISPVRLRKLVKQAKIQAKRRQEASETR